MKKFYKELVDLPGTSGQEKYIRRYMRKHLEQVSEEVIEDTLGSIFGVLNKDIDIFFLPSSEEYIISR